MQTSDILAHMRREIVDTVASFDAELIEYVNLAVQQAEEQHNYRHMEASAQYVTTEATRLLTALPDRWKSARAFPYLTTDDDDTRIEINWGASESDMVRMYGESVTLDSGQPQFIYQTSTGLDVYPLPSGDSDYSDGDWRVTIPYWQYSVDLDDADDTVTNWWSENKPWYIIYQGASLVLAGMRDLNNAAIKAQLAAPILSRAEKQDKRSRLPDRMTLNISRGVYRPGLRPRSGGYRGGGYLP